jgi:hypothetical protein
MLLGKSMQSFKIRSRPDLNCQAEQPLSRLHTGLALLACVLHRRQVLIEAFELRPIASRRGSVGEGDWQQVAGMHCMMQDGFDPCLQ